MTLGTPHAFYSCLSFFLFTVYLIMYPPPQKASLAASHIFCSSLQLKWFVQAQIILIWLSKCIIQNVTGKEVDTLLPSSSDVPWGKQ